MHPELFHIVGPVSVKSYGTMLMLGFLAGIWLAWREAKRRGLPGELAIDLGLWTLVGGMVFARLVFAALNWGAYRSDPVRALFIWKEGGLTFHGGLLGGVLAGVLLARRRRIPVGTLADVAAPALALGYAIARVGCFLNGCCYGGPTSLPWGVRFPEFLEAGLTTPPSHPTQIYASLGSLVILAVLLKARHRLRAPGQVFLLYLMLYSVLRAGIEVLRRDVTASRLFDGVTQAQVACGVIFLAALAWMMVLGRRRKADPRAGAASP